MTPRARAFLDSIERWQTLSPVVDEQRGVAELWAGTSLIASVDLRSEEVVVKAPADVLPGLLEAFPSGEAVSDGLRLSLVDEATALAAVRRRLTVEQVAWQYRERSP